MVEEEVINHKLQSILVVTIIEAGQNNRETAAANHLRTEATEET